MVERVALREPLGPCVFVVVSRQVVIDSSFSTVICAPIYTRFSGLSTQVEIGTAEGLKHTSAIHCDELISLPKITLRDFVGTLDHAVLKGLDRALAIALALA